MAQSGSGTNLGVATLERLNVGCADAASFHRQQDFSAFGLRLRGFLDADIARTVILERLHADLGFFRKRTPRTASLRTEITMRSGSFKRRKGLPSTHNTAPSRTFSTTMLTSSESVT